MFYLAVPAPFLNDAPEPDQVFKVRFKRLAVGAFCNRADDRPAIEAVVLEQALDQQAQALPFVVLLDTRGNPYAAAPRQQHQVPRGQRDERGQACALVAQRVLDDLDEQAIALPDEFADVGQILLRVAGGAVARNVRRVQKRRPFEPDVHESRLHAGQDAGDPAVVDVADQAAARRALDEDLLQDAILEQRRTCFRRRDVDQDFFFFC